MSRRTIAMVMQLLVVIAALCWGAGQLAAQSQPPAKTQTTGKWFRDPNKIVKLRSTTPAQRKAAARSAAARRAAQGKSNVPTTQQGEVKK